MTIHRRPRSSTPGPIAAQEAFDIGPDDDAGAVYARAAEVAARLLDGVLAAIRRFTPQPDEGVTYAEKITAGDRELDLSRPARRARRPRARALAAHRRARVSTGGR